MESRVWEKHRAESEGVEDMKEAAYHRAILASQANPDQDNGTSGQPSEAGPKATAVGRHVANCVLFVILPNV